MKDKDAKLLWESYMESSKPDFADIDKDGDKKESMKKAAKDKEELLGLGQQQVLSWAYRSRGPKCWNCRLQHLC